MKRTSRVHRERERRQREAQTKVDRLNTVLLSREELIRKHEQAMLAPKIGNKEYKAIQNEIASVKADNALTEEQVLEAMEEVDECARDVEEARRELAGHEAALGEAERRVETEVGQFDRRIEELAAEREARLAELPGEVTTVYEKVHAARGSSVVAAVSEGYCQGCYMQVTMQDVALILKGGKLRQCKTCQRILYVPNPADWISDG